MHPNQRQRSVAFDRVSISVIQAIVVCCSGLASHAIFAADEEPVSVAISVPASSATNGNRMIRAGAADAHFHVVVTNVSEKPQRIWRDDCSWGYAALSFEFTDDTGKTWTAEKKPRGWLANEPFYWILKAHENLVFDVNFTSTDLERFSRGSAAWAQGRRYAGDLRNQTRRRIAPARSVDRTRAVAIWEIHIFELNASETLHQWA